MVMLDIGFCFTTTLNKMLSKIFEMEKKGEGEDMEQWNQYHLGRGYKGNRNGENKNRTPFVFDVNIDNTTLNKMLCNGLGTEKGEGGVRICNCGINIIFMVGTGVGKIKIEPPLYLT